MLQDCGELRTISSLGRLRSRWIDKSGVLKKAKEYGNVVNVPIFDSAAADTLVLDILPPPGYYDKSVSVIYTDNRLDIDQCM